MSICIVTIEIIPYQNKCINKTAQAAIVENTSFILAGVENSLMQWYSSD